MIAMAAMADTPSRNGSGGILSWFSDTINWDQSFTSTQNVFIIPPTQPHRRNLHDISPSVVECRQTANIFTNPDCNLILQRGRADEQSP